MLIVKSQGLKDNYERIYVLSDIGFRQKKRKSVFMWELPIKDRILSWNINMCPTDIVQACQQPNTNNLKKSITLTDQPEIHSHFKLQ